MGQSENAVHIICKCIVLCESDSASFSSAFSCLIFVRANVLNAGCPSSAQRATLYTWWLRQSNQILSSVHNLLYIFDPFYIPMRAAILAAFGQAFLQFDCSSLNCHGHLALRILANDDAYYDALIEISCASAHLPIRCWKSSLIGTLPHMDSCLI